MLSPIHHHNYQVETEKTWKEGGDCEQVDFETGVVEEPIDRANVQGANRQRQYVGTRIAV